MAGFDLHMLDPMQEPNQPTGRDNPLNSLGKTIAATHNRRDTPVPPTDLKVISLLHNAAIGPLVKAALKTPQGLTPDPGCRALKTIDDRVKEAKQRDLSASQRATTEGP
jgi:hypothetical protein